MNDVTNEIGVPMIVKLNKLVAGRNPRTHFDEIEMNELIDSVRASGIAQPILIRPLSDGRFRIIAGERRVRAATAVYGEEGEIPALARECSDDEEDVLSLVENVDRAAMSGAEEAEQANRVLIRCKGDKTEASAVLGWEMAKLNRRLALMQLTVECRQALTARSIKLGHAELLASVPKDKQNAALEKIIAAKVSVFDLKRQVAAMAKDLTKACFDTSGCAQCPFNSAQQHALFVEVVQEGVCTNPSCFDTKVEAKLAEIAGVLSGEVPKVIILRQETVEQPIRLVKEGKGAVGAEQFEACKGCAQYGASVSALPGSTAEVEKGLCFDAACNLKKVSTFLKQVAGKPAAAGKAPLKAGDGQAAKAGGDKPKKSVVSVGAVTAKVKEYRVTQWRKIAAKVTYSSPDLALRMLVSLALGGFSRHIDSTKLKEAFCALTKTEKYPGGSNSLKAASDCLKDVPLPVVTSLAHVMAASAFKEIDEQRLKEGLTVLNVKLEDHWQISAEYLGLLTKSEMEALAGEIGLLEVMGADALKKALAMKKDQAVAALLAVEGFAYKGVVPKAMRFDQARQAEGTDLIADDANGGVEEADEETEELAEA